MVLEADVLLLLPASVLNVEDADEVRGPAPHEAVEHLQDDPRHHPQLRERVRQRQQHLRHLHANTPAGGRRLVEMILCSKHRVGGRLGAIDPCNAVDLHGVRTWLEAQLNQASQAEQVDFYVLRTIMTSVDARFKNSIGFTFSFVRCTRQ